MNNRPLETTNMSESEFNTMSSELNDDELGQQRPTIGVAIGGGGLKAMSSIALFKFLDVQGLQPDVVAGCSAGALVAAMKGAGFTHAQMQEVAFEIANPKMFSEFDIRSLLGIANIPGGKFDKRSGLVNPKRIQSFYRELFDDLRLEDLYPQTVLVATDVTTGQKVALEQGLVADAVYASAALWPLMPPIEVNGRLLIDGGYSNPLPLFELVQRNTDVNIAMIFDEKPDPNPTGFAGCLNNQIGITLQTLTRSQNVMSIELHHHETILIQFVSDTPVVQSPDSVPHVLDIGRQLVKQHAAEILSAVTEFKPR
jgi:NTE family protein